MTPQQFCEKHNACPSGKDFAYQFSTMEEVWNKCESIDWLFWILNRTDTNYNKQKLGALFVREIWHRLKDQRSKDAIIAIEEDRLTPEIKNAAYAAYAANAANAAAAAYAAAVDTAVSVAAVAAYAANSAALDVYSAVYAGDAAYAAAADARCKIRAKQARILKNFVPNPFKAKTSDNKAEQP